MKSSDLLLLFFILWSTFLEYIIIYQYIKRKEIEKNIDDVTLENLHLRKFTNR